MEDATKFIITGQGRCGSNLLKFALKKHPHCSVIGEYFNKNVYDDVFEEDGNVRAEKYFSNVQPKKRCIGFKIFAHQGTRRPAKSVWKFLSDPKNNVHVIHLLRSNRFERILSYEVARKTGAWLYKEEKLHDYLSLKIKHSPRWWQKAFEKDKRIDKEVESFFQDVPYLRLTYEDLSDDWDNCMAAIQKFLHLKVRPLPKTLKKQEVLKKSDRLKNYQDLVSYFSDTEFAWMFQD